MKEREDSYLRKQSKLYNRGDIESMDVVSQQKWIRVYTTNYDDVLEIAGEQVGRIYTKELFINSIGVSPKMGW